MAFPCDCNEMDCATGGALMKLMDTAAGVVAVRHTKGRVATISIDNIDFQRPVKMGEVITAIGTVTFTSNNVMEVLTRVITEDMRTEERHLAVVALFNFVVLDKTHKIPPLVLTNDYEKLLFEKGKLRYENRKKNLKKRK